MRDAPERTQPTPDPLELFAGQQELLVEGDGLRETGRFGAATETELRLRYSYGDEEKVIPWARIRRISRREGSGAPLAAPGCLALLGAGLFGACGGMLDALHESTSGNKPDNPLALWTALIGAVVGGGLGALVLAAFPRRHWVIVFDVPAGAAPPVTAPLDARLRDGRTAAVESEAKVDGRREAGLILARSVLFILIFFVLSALAALL